MFSYIKGTLISISPVEAVIEAGGIGYLISVPLHVHTHLPSVGQEAQLHLSVVIRDDAHELYGFHTQDERNLFKKLCSVSGVGPKIALSLIGHLAWKDLCMAISSGNSQMLCSIPGVGKKTAERLIIDLKDKVKNLSCVESLPQNSSSTDAIQALIHLGYKPGQAQRAVQAALNAAETPPSLSKLITLSLRHI